MANSDQKKHGPIGPIVRKTKSETEETVDASGETEALAAQAAAPVVTPEPAPAPAPTPAPVEEEAPQLSRRVVEVKKEEPKPVQREMVQETTVEQGSMEDFEALLAGETAAPTKVRLNVGDKVDGYVAKIGERYIYIELPGGLEGMAERRDFEDKDGAMTVGEGETLSFYVINMRGGIQLGTKMSTQGGAVAALEQAFVSGVPVEGKVVSKNKGGYDIEIQGVRAFCPHSQIEIAYTEDPDVHIGKNYRFRVSKFDEDGRNILVSRAALQKEERDAQAEITLKSLLPGAVVSGTVTRLADFGAFVELGGVEGLIHISELSYTRVEHPSEAVEVDEIVEVKVLSIEESEKGPRISLSIRQTLSDPWDSKIDDFVEGSKIEGTVTRTEVFGAFVEIAPGLEGLVHISEMSWEKHVKRPSDVVHVGEKVMVEVQSIDKARQRIGLSMKGSASDPWTNINERFVEGLEVEGEVENLEDFGVFVRLSGGVTALIPRSEMDLPRDATPHRKFKVGDTLTARVLSIEPARRRMALTMRSAEDVAATNEAQTAPRSFAEPSSSFGTFADLLKPKSDG